MATKTGTILTKRELEVMQVLWHAETGLTASEIIKTNPDLNKNTVQLVLRKLLKSNIIKVSEIVYSNTVLARRFEPVISESDYDLTSLTRQYMQLSKHVSKAMLLSQILKDEDDPEALHKDLIELQAILDQYKKKSKRN